MNQSLNPAVNLVLDGVKEFFKTHPTFAHPTIKGKYLVAVSGGVDSVVLLKALYLLRENLNLDLGVFHLNHNFRNDASDSDAQLVKDMAKQMKLPYFGYRRPVEKLAADYGMSFEAMGRKLRYDLAKALFLAEGYQGLFTAHHIDDQAETVLMHLFRGSSLKGLTGIAPVHDFKCRPLLGIQKETLCEAAAFWGLDFHEDYTNRDNAYLRNYLRNDVIPALESQFGRQMGRRLAKMAQLLRDDEHYLQQRALDEMAPMVSEVDQGLHMDIQGLLNTPLALRRRIFVTVMHRLLGYATDLSNAPIDQWFLWLENSKIGSEHTYLGVHFEKRRHQVRALLATQYLQRFEKVEFALKIGAQRIQSLGIEWLMTPVAQNQLLKDDFSRLDVMVIPEVWWTDDLVVRERKEGDVIGILGTQGKHKSVRKLFSEWDLASDQKVNFPILVKGETLIWIPFKAKVRDVEIAVLEHEKLLKIQVRPL